MPTYGRSFTLVNAGQNNVNSPSSGGGEAGKYTGEAGFMAYYEVGFEVVFLFVCFSSLDLKFCFEVFLLLFSRLVSFYFTFCVCLLLLFFSFGMVG